MKFIILIFCLYLPASMLYAVPLYIEQINHAKTDNKELEEAHKQIKEHKEVSLKKNIFVSSFHKQNSKIATDKKSLCSICHNSPPHSTNERKRSFLNMHSRYISCETCHFRPKNIKLEYRWLNFNNATNKIPEKRITPFFNNEAVLIFSDHELAKRADIKWQKDSSIDKAQIKLHLHEPLNKEGPKCLDCHSSKNQLLDLKALGFDKKEIRKLQQHSIPRFFSRFTKEDQRLRMSDLLK
jgi:DNA-directed RNA polymerase subunit M/transcription elongation factor TFIIS